MQIIIILANHAGCAEPPQAMSQSEPMSQSEDLDVLPSSTPYSRARYILVYYIARLFMLLLICRSIIASKQISHNQVLGVFTVVGTTGNAHAVRLFPRESCTCPSTNRCYHILAVRMSIGLEDIDAKKTINLTQLRRNVRSRREKKSGRKVPRPGDYEVIPAPDASYPPEQVTTIYNTSSIAIIMPYYRIRKMLTLPAKGLMGAR